MGREEEIKQVVDLMTWWVLKIKANNYIEFFDINKVAEDLALKLLNEIYGLQLVNLNIEKPNYPGIDLGDKINKVAYQVTSRNDSQKIKKSLESFVKKDKKTFSKGIRFLILDDTKPKLTGKKWQDIDGDFNPKEHILTHKDLIKETKKLYDDDRSRFDHIKRILEEEINQKLLRGVQGGSFLEKRPPGRRRQEKQIKILSITASPDDVDDIYYEIEQDTLLEAFKSFDREEVFLDMPDPVKDTLTGIAEYLNDGLHDILHITAHGSINEQGTGVLCLEDRLGGLEEVTGQELVKVLEPAPRVVILSACHSARKEPDLMPVALALYDAGIKTVIGMKKAISHAAAIEFNVAFFKALCRENTVEQAFENGKDAIFKGEQERVKEIPNWEAIKENEIPQLLSRDKKLTMKKFSDHRIEAPGRPESHHFMGARYLERGFIGRRQVLRGIFKAIDNKEGAIVLKGPGGIGKSTLTTRAAANLRRKGYEFIVVRGETTIEQILEAISKKAAAQGIEGANEVYAANADVNEKLAWYLDYFLLKQKTVIILDNFEENQDEKKGGFLKERLKKFLWFFRESLTHKESFLFFSTRYKLPGFDSPEITKEIPEFTPVEFRKMLRGSKALKRLDGKSVKNLKQEIGGNPRAMELLDKIALEEFKQKEFTWEQLKDLFPEMLERMIREKSEADDFNPLFLDKLFGYLTESQRLLLDTLSIYRNPVPKDAVEAHNVSMKRQDRKKLVDLSLLECIDLEEKKDLYYVHRLTAQYLLAQMEPGVKNNYHVRAAQYFAEIRTVEGKKYLHNDIESRWHHLQAGEWDKAAEITFDLEDYLTLHGFPQWSMELLRELEIDRLKETHQLVAYGQIGSLYLHFGEYDKSINFHKKAYKISKKSNDLRNSATALHQIGIIYEYKGDYDEALRHYQQSLEIKEKIGDTKGIANSLHQIGRIYEEKGDYDEALRHYQQSLEIREKIGDTKGIAQSLHQIGRIYEEKGDYDEALKQYEVARKLFEQMGAQKELADSLHQIGIIYEYKGDYDEAFRHYQQSLEIREKIGDTKGIASSLHQIGRIYEEKGAYDKALHQYEKGRKIFEEMGAQKELAAALHQIGIIYEKKGDYDEALRHYQQSLEIKEKIGYIPGMALSMGQMGQVYLIKKEYPKALTISLQSLMILLKIGSPKAEIVKRNIQRIREHLPEEQFHALLKEFDLEPGLFDKSEEEEEAEPEDKQKKPM